jgi:hypothetical protein
MSLNKGENKIAWIKISIIGLELNGSFDSPRGNGE